MVGSSFPICQVNTRSVRAVVGSYSRLLAFFFSEVSDINFAPRLTLDPVWTQMGPSDPDLRPPGSKKVFAQSGTQKESGPLGHRIGLRI